MASSYSELLRDPRWQKKRLIILQRDRFTCQVCGDDTNTLHVHHKYYLRGNSPWEYPDAALITLCKECHEAETDELKDFEPLLIRAIAEAGFMADQYRELAFGFSQLRLQHAPEVVASAFAFALGSPEIQDRLLEIIFERNPAWSARRKAFVESLQGSTEAV